MLRKLLGTLCLLTLALGLNPARAAQLEAVPAFGYNPAGLAMYQYVPDNLRPNAPLVVAMHGCWQSAEDYAANSGWIKYAERWGFAVVLPEQNPAYNYARCFNWFIEGFAALEAVSVRSMVANAVAEHGLDAERVYVTGVSAGAAAGANLVATAPGEFAGAALIAGIAHGCAAGGSSIEESVALGQYCMLQGLDRSPQQWGDLVRATSGNYSGPWPKVVIWQGGLDPFVVPMNRNELVEQWTNVHGTDAQADVINTVRGAEHQVFLDAYGRPVVESYTVPGMGHGVPVDPGAAAWECGATHPEAPLTDGSAYFLDANVCSSYYIAWDFGLMFPEHPREVVRDTMDLVRSLRP